MVSPEAERLPDVPAPLVSVVVPTYERRVLAEETLRSILAQTLTDMEVIVVDNMSDDGTDEMVAGLGDARVRYVRNANDGIIARNRNLGIRLARGDYVAFCDDDDLWEPTKLAEQCALLQAQPAAALCYTNAVGFRHEDHAVTDRSRVRWDVRQQHFRRLVLRNFIPTSSVVARRRVLLELGCFDERTELVPYEDYELWLRVAYQHPLAYLPRHLLRYRIHATGWAGRHGRRQPIVLNVLRSVRGKLPRRSLPLAGGIILRRVLAALEPRA